ncbi:MAG TPA: gamma-glutamyltransferase [Vicinamibacterales bacterium]|jgi:gamma-glutamyltranspeptidase/glutathione hydrolase|nr:gamma-glutamyltransferase [Vicinamibacterales bacterium]
MTIRTLAPAALLVVALAVLLFGQEPSEKPSIVAGRSKVATKYGIVAASQPLAARAGVQMLERGGNAVDAAIAANAVMALVEPHYNGIGGDLFAIYYEARTGKLYGLNAGGWAPAGLTPEFLEAKGIVRMPGGGIHSVTVPGAVAGWDAMRARFGKLPMADLLAPAIFYADDGFPVTDVIAEYWAGGAARLAAEPLAAETFLPNGRAPRAGEVFRNPRLAGTLRLIAQKGAAGFYEGKTAEAIVAVSRVKGGAMTLADLKDYKPEWVEPISTTYRGWTVSELPPNTQGIAALMMLNIMERYPIAEYRLHTAGTMHVEIEAKKLAYADMLRYVADPHFSNVPVTSLLDKTHAAERARLIDPRKAACEVEPSRLPGFTTSNGGDTIYLSTIDHDGNIVSLIQSLYSSFGSGIVPPDTGVMLHNRGALFTLEPGHPNLLAGRKRPLTTLIPAFMSKGDVKIGFGIMGGFNQAQAHAQFVSNVADFGLDVQEALEAGRFTKISFDGCDVDVEELIPAKTRNELETLGHEVTVIPPRSGVFGYGQAVMSDGNGVHFGGSEPRHDGEAIPEAPPVFGPIRRP